LDPKAYPGASISKYTERIPERPFAASGIAVELIYDTVELDARTAFAMGLEVYVSKGIT
jgi:hypothetical protein